MTRGGGGGVGGWGGTRLVQGSPSIDAAAAQRASNLGSARLGRHKSLSGEVVIGWGREQDRFRQNYITRRAAKLFLGRKMM